MIPTDHELLGYGLVADRGSTYEAHDVTKSFAGVPVLNGITLTFAKGEVHSILGANGAGKSTLLKIMAGLYAPDSGQLVLDGAALAPLSPSRAQHNGIYLVPQEPRVLADLSIAENIFLGTLPRGRFGRTVDWRTTNALAAELLETVGLKEDPRSLAGSLSLAHQQLLECARALAHRCSVIFFDEPTSPLTASEAGRLFVLIDELRRRSLTLGFISHRMTEVEEISDRITVLRDGEVVAREVRGSASRASLTSAMVGHSVSLSRRTARAQQPGDVVLDVRNLVAAPKVRDISLQVRAGEIVGLAGLVGSGRTELSEAILGLRRLSGGSILVSGKETTGLTPRKCIQAGLVYLPEDRARNGIFAEVDLVRNTSVAVLSSLPRSLGLIRMPKEDALVRDSLQRAGVRAPGLYSPIRSLSGGNQQKVLFARWAMAKPKVAIFDEPTRGVDVGAKEGIYEIIESLAEARVGVLVICSELEELVRLCDRVYVVYEGKVVGELFDSEITLATVGELAVGAA